MDKMQHPTHNRVLGAPHGWDQNGVPCGALSVRVDRLGGHQTLVSHWRPTAEELEALQRGAVVALAIIGDTMPPVSLWLENPT